MKTGWAILLCFSVWFGWARYDQYKTETAAHNMQRAIDDYHSCINSHLKDSLTALECPNPMEAK
jgi:hypothetical protein